MDLVREFQDNGMIIAATVALWAEPAVGSGPGAGVLEGEPSSSAMSAWGRWTLCVCDLLWFFFGKFDGFAVTLTHTRILSVLVFLCDRNEAILRCVSKRSLVVWVIGIH